MGKVGFWGDNGGFALEDGSVSAGALRGKPWLARRDEVDWGQAYAGHRQPVVPCSRLDRSKHFGRLFTRQRQGSRTVLRICSWLRSRESRLVLQRPACAGGGRSRT